MSFCYGKYTHRLNKRFNRYLSSFCVISSLLKDNKISFYKLIFLPGRVGIQFKSAAVLKPLMYLTDGEAAQRRTHYSINFFAVQALERSSPHLYPLAGVGYQYHPPPILCRRYENYMDIGECAIIHPFQFFTTLLNSNIC